MDIRWPLKKLQECFMAEGHNRFTQHRVELGWLPPANHDPNLA
jgi:hypothetical protein